MGLPLDRLRPRIRPRRFYELDTRPKRPFYRPLATYLGVGLVFDREHVEYIEEPDKLGFGVTELEELALANLERIHTRGRFESSTPGVWRAKFPDGFAAERMLLPDVFDELTLDGDPVVFMPSDDELIVAGSNDTDALTAAFTMTAEKELDFAFVRKSGTWEPFVGDGPLAETQEHRVLFHLGPAFALQEEHLKDEAPDLAPFRVHTIARLSFTPWKKGTTTWLPATSVIELDEGTGEVVMANWADVVALVPDSLSLVPEVWPDRYETKRFPPPEVIAKFRKDLEEPAKRLSPARIAATLATIAIVLYLLLRK